MDKFTIVIPFYNGHNTIYRLLRSIPSNIPVIIVDDRSDKRFELDFDQVGTRQEIKALHLNKKGYFTGAVNAGMKACKTDVLILNQDSYFDLDRDWLDMIDKNQGEYDLIGEGVAGTHPAWKKGYIHGTFMWIKRIVIDTLGPMNEIDYPLWGSTCEYQLRACRAGFKAMPYRPVVGFNHLRHSGRRFGDSIEQLLAKEPENFQKLVRVPPMISVIIPTFKHGKYLKDAVNSLIGGETTIGEHPGQTFASFEVIIVDDHSPDETGQIAKELVDPWKGVHYIRRHQNGGTAAANNTGIQNAHGKYITIMCGDDMMEPDRLETLFRIAEQNPGNLVYDDCTMFWDNGKTKHFPLQDYNFNELIFKNHMHCGIMFEREDWRKVGGYPAQFSHGREDWAMNVRLGVNGVCGVKVPDHYAGYLYRQHNENRTRRNTTPSHHMGFLQKIKQLHPEAYLNEGARPMACCGGRRNSPVNTSKTAKAVTYPGSVNGMTLVEYLGGNTGKTPYWGDATGVRYMFSKVPRDKIRNVDNADVAGLLDIVERKNKTFRLYERPVDIQEDEVLEENTKVTEERVPDPKAEKSTVEEVIDEIIETSTVIDPTDYSVSKFKKEFEKTKGKMNIPKMVELEKENKQRVTVVAYLESYLESVG